jgi:hypothetical protein
MMSNTTYPFAIIIIETDHNNKTYGWSAIHMDDFIGAIRQRAHSETMKLSECLDWLDKQTTECEMIFEISEEYIERSYSPNNLKRNLIIREARKLGWFPDEQNTQPISL